MKNHIKLLFLFFFLSLKTFGQDSASRVIPYDSSAVSLRSFSSEKLQAYKENGDFIYQSNYKEGPGLIERIISWILSKLFSNYSVSKVYFYIYNFFLYVLTPLVVIFILWKLFGADKRFFLYGSSKKNKMNFEEAPENIHEINFDKLIQEAISKQQFRLAVRLSYLLLLKELTIKNLITWSPEKTNYEYLREIKENKTRDQFAHNTLMYEYVWYGDFEINQENFTKVSGAFRAFTEQIKGRQ
ncbi:MAG TPA: DUF4129 domain-containing protein [Cytophagaceae bacterium]|jgi:hypothetical protein|nr:DUF4129 domain-containing protein [Cytophagaceae bacterium]